MKAPVLMSVGRSTWVGCKGTVGVKGVTKPETAFITACSRPHSNVNDFGPASAPGPNSDSFKHADNSSRISECMWRRTNGRALLLSSGAIEMRERAAHARFIDSTRHLRAKNYSITFEVACQQA